MLEVPALLWQLPELMAEADFVSIGANDLMQFVFAADRGTPALAERYDFLSAPMLRLLTNRVHSRRLRHVRSRCAARRPAARWTPPCCWRWAWTRLSMSASGLLPVKEALTALDLGGAASFMRHAEADGGPHSSLREPHAAWARDHGLAV